VSRIDEALQRSRGDHTGVAPLPEQNQFNFLPAWTLSPSAPTSAASDPDEAALAPAPTPVARAEGVQTSDGHRLQGAAQDVPQGILSFSSEWRERLAGGPDADPGLIEQFRRLAATLHRAHAANGLRSVMVTSACPGDGKTLTALNLALVLAESYRYNVLLLDADLRRPSIPSLVHVSDGSGLSEALRAQTEQRLALIRVTTGLTLLPAGQPVANSIEALTSPRMQQILAEAGERFDWVIVDAPPVGLTTDARLLTQMVGGTLLVVRAGRTQYDDVQQAVEAIGRDEILGVVLNGVEDSGGAGYYYGPDASRTG